MPSKTNNIFEAIIIGAGPAGIAAAVQLKRSGIKFIIFEKDKPGGLLRNASLVENYPGFPRGIGGLELANKFSEQLGMFNIKIRNEEVLRVRELKENFTVVTKENHYKAKYLVLASGTKPAPFKPVNSGVKVYNNIVDINNIENKNILIYGGSDAAFDYAVSVSKTASNVKIMHRGKKPQCIKPLERKVKSVNNIIYINHTEISTLEKSLGQNSAICLNTKKRIQYKIHFDIFIAAIGREPELGYLAKELRNKVTNGESKRIFPAGDVMNGLFRQTSISTGDGIIAAMKIFNKIKSDDDCKS